MTGSLSPLKLLQNRYPNSYKNSVYGIHDEICKLNKFGKSVDIRVEWIPALEDITGNEIVDLAAKAAHCCGDPPKYCYYNDNPQHTHIHSRIMMVWSPTAPYNHPYRLDTFLFLYLNRPTHNNYRGFLIILHRGQDLPYHSHFSGVLTGVLLLLHENKIQIPKLKLCPNYSLAIKYSFTYISTLFPSLVQFLTRPSGRANPKMYTTSCAPKSFTDT